MNWRSIKLLKPCESLLKTINKKLNVYTNFIGYSRKKRHLDPVKAFLLARSIKHLIKDLERVERILYAYQASIYQNNPITED